jgi:hypothetical protein
MTTRPDPIATAPAARSTTPDTTLDGLAAEVERELRPQARRNSPLGTPVRTAIDTPSDDVRAVHLETGKPAEPELEVVVELGRAEPDWAVSGQATNGAGIVVEEFPVRLVEAPDAVVATAARFVDDVLPGR